MSESKYKLVKMAVTVLLVLWLLGVVVVYFRLQLGRVAEMLTP